MDALELLKQDHQKVKEPFNTNRKTRNGRFKEIKS
jgi:hypothetical protein